MIVPDQITNKNQQTTTCPFENKCAFILNNQEKMPELIEKTRKQYCVNSFSACARVKVYEALGPSCVPSLLLPSQHEWAKQILFDATADDADF